MPIKSVNLSNSLSINDSIISLCIFFGAYVPITKIFFHTIPWIHNYGEILFFLIVIMVITRKVDFIDLGFSIKYLKQHLVLGFVVSGVLVSSVPLLAKGFEIMGLTNLTLLKEKTENINSLNMIFFLKNIPALVLIPVVEQVYFTGFIMHTLLKRINPILAIYAGGIIYAMVGFKLNLGAFGLGVFTSLLFKITGTLYAPILFHIGCETVNLLVNIAYPWLITIFSFLA